MSTFYDRLLIEKAEVSERADKLESYIGTDSFRAIDPRQQSLLNIQIAAMRTYQQCLTERIALLSPQSGN